MDDGIEFTESTESLFWLTQWPTCSTIEATGPDMAFQIFDSETNRRAATGAMVNISRDGVFKFNVGATGIIQEHKARKLLLLWDPERRRIGVAVAKTNDRRGYTITHNKGKSTSQIVARPFPRYAGIKTDERSFRVELQRDAGGEAILEGTIPSKYLTAKPG